MKRGDDNDGWQIDNGDGAAESPSALSPRFFNMAVRFLGYTHTEAGFRTIAQLDAEYEDMLRMTRRKAAGTMDEDFEREDVR